MDPITILTAANGALTLIEALAPAVKALVASGQISPEDQAKLDARISNLRPGGTAFAGPEWQPSNQS